MFRSSHVRNLDEEIVRRPKSRTASHGRPAEAEHREIRRHLVSAEAEPSFTDFAAWMRETSAGRMHTPAEQLRAEGRAER